MLTEADLLTGYTTDWTRRYHGDALCVVRPGSAPQVAAVLRACRAHGAHLVPQGGNTGLVGGSVPASTTAVLRRTGVPIRTPVPQTVVAARRTQARSCCLPVGCANSARWTRWPRR